jgi:hypothetical protein
MLEGQSFDLYAKNFGRSQRNKTVLGGISFDELPD